MELKIQSERILEAAEKCAEVKATMKILFPEAFAAKAIPNGVFMVRSKGAIGNPKSTYTAVANKEMVAAYEDCFDHLVGLVVVVLITSPNKKPNGYPYASWEEFHEAWEKV